MYLIALVMQALYTLAQVYLSQPLPDTLASEFLQKLISYNADLYHGWSRAVRCACRMMRN